MVLIHNRHRNYRGEWVWPGDPVENYTDSQAEEMVKCGQAYWGDEEAPQTNAPEAESYPYHIGGGWYKTSSGETLKGREAAEQVEND